MCCCKLTGLAWVGVGLFGLATLFALVTLPVEFDASDRAKQALIQVGLVDSGVSGGQESKGVAAVLSAAGWTYVAELRFFGADPALLRDDGHGNAPGVSMFARYRWSTHRCTAAARP